jgi:RecA-family ATPase
VSRNSVDRLDQAILNYPGQVMPLLDAGPDKTPKPHLKRLTVADVQTNPPIPPSYAWEGLVPISHVSLLSAHGGVGKSTIALMLCVAAALNRPLFGIPTKASKALFVSLEDAPSVLRHRLAWISREWNLNPVDLDERLAVVDGTDYPEMFTTTGRTDAGSPTGTYDELVDLVEREGFGLIVIDNASDAFDGDEIQRRQVRAFMRKLSLLAKNAGCAILLLAHVDKGTSRSARNENDEGYSGSTAWHNSSRSRLFLRRNSGEMLELVHQKNNLGRRCEPLVLIWPGNPPLLQGVQK